MLFILKTLLFAPSPKKLDVYQTQFQAVFKGCNVLFDQLFSLIAAFYNSYQEFLKPEALLARLNEDGQIKLVDYLSNLLTDPTIPIYSEESDFFAALEQEEIELKTNVSNYAYRNACQSTKWLRQGEYAELDTGRRIALANALCIGFYQSALSFGPFSPNGPLFLPAEW